MKETTELVYNEAKYAYESFLKKNRRLDEKAGILIGFTTAIIVFLMNSPSSDITNLPLVGCLFLFSIICAFGVYFPIMFQSPALDIDYKKVKRDILPKEYENELKEFIKDYLECRKILQNLNIIKAALVDFSMAFLISGILALLSSLISIVNNIVFVPVFLIVAKLVYEEIHKHQKEDGEADG